MDKKVKTTEFKIVENYADTLDDSINKKGSKREKPQGYVEIYDVLPNGKKKLIGKHNLILYIGREWLAQRLVNRDNIYVTSSKDEFLTWFGVGTGGVIPGDPFNPQPPVLTNTNLSNGVMINATDSSCADYYTATMVPAADVGYYKCPFDSVDFEQDSLNDDKYLVLKVTVTIGINDANGNQLSEAGLFTAESSSGGWGVNGDKNFTLFARVTYPSIIKTSDRRLLFYWYLYV